MGIDGWKTYLISLVLISFGIGAFFADKIDITRAMEIIGLGIGFATMRHAIRKAEVPQTPVN